MSSLEPAAVSSRSAKPYFLCFALSRHTPSRSRRAWRPSLCHRRVTHSRNRRIEEVTGGHEADRARVQEEPCGPHRTRTASRRFGTVRHQVELRDLARDRSLGGGGHEPSAGPNGIRGSRVEDLVQARGVVEQPVPVGEGSDHLATRCRFQVALGSSLIVGSVAVTPVNSRTPTSRSRFETADPPGRVRESHLEAVRAANGTRDGRRSHPRIGGPPLARP